MLQKRSYKPELLDGDNIPFEDIKRNMEELNTINKYLGGHDITLDGIAYIIQNSLKFNDQLHIVEIGCGGGDNLRIIKKWADHIKLPVELTGIDINEECISYATKIKNNNGIHFIHSDYRNVYFQYTPDIIFSSLFCHHFTNEELVHMMQWMKKNSNAGFFINDLHRHLIAYYSIKVLTSLFSKSYLVKNDAPLSVKRGFKKYELNAIFRSAGIKNFKIEWKWAFRWLGVSINHAN